MNATALILAAGKGTRMRSALPKVLHPLCGRPMVRWVLSAVEEAGCAPLVVVGHQADRVRAALGEGVPTALQAEQKGTGHAVAQAAASIPAEGRLLVLCGDTPLLQPETLTALLEAGPEALCTVVTTMLPEEAVPEAAYGRLIRDERGAPRAIVEWADATPEQRMVREVNSGVYAFDAAWLLGEVLPTLRPHPPKGELYLTDAVEAAAAAGRLAVMLLEDAEQLSGVNNRAQSARAEGVLRDRVHQRWMEAGVTLRSPDTCAVDASVTLARDVTLGPGVVLTGDTRVEEGAVIGPYSVLHDTRVGAGSVVKAHSVGESAVIGPGCAVGPFARLREGTVLGEGVKVGNFVETKKATLGPGAKASHLSYLGDCAVGAEANIGAGTITCNYDGYGKHVTDIGPRAFIGSNTALVAPVSIGEGAIVGAGSTITRDVDPEALALTRPPQVQRDDFAPELRRRNAEKAGKTP